MKVAIIDSIEPVMNRIEHNQTDDTTNTWYKLPLVYQMSIEIWYWNDHSPTELLWNYIIDSEQSIDSI